MKFFLLITGCLIYISPAAAYLEEQHNGETELTSGEQNTNMYNLNMATEVKMKQLKKISEAMERNPDLNYSDTDVVERLLSGKNDVDLDAEAQLQKLSAEVNELTAQKKTLVVSQDENLKRIQETSGQIRDKEAASELMRLIRRK